jgi:hypothetical protein
MPLATRCQSEYNTPCEKEGRFWRTQVNADYRRCVAEIGEYLRLFVFSSFLPEPVGSTYVA